MPARERSGDKGGVGAFSYDLMVGGCCRYTGRGEKMIKIISPFSAIPSWEGFEYQGHIALFIVLKHIWHEIELGNREEINLELRVKKIFQLLRVVIMLVCIR